MSSERREIVLPRGLRVLFWVGAIGLVVYWLRAVLTPVFLAFVIAYILDPVVDRLERLRLPRPVAIVVVLGAAFGLLALFALLVLPSIAADVAAFAADLPAKTTAVLEGLERWLAERGIDVPDSTSEWLERFGAQLQGAAGTAVGAATNVLGIVIGGTASFLGAVVAALIVPVLAVYLLNDFDRMIAGARELVPLRYKSRVIEYAREVDAVLSHFFRGQLTVMVILAILYGGAYAALGVRLAAPIGIAAGVLNFIPYLGGAFALVAGVVMSLLGGFDAAQLAGVVIAYAAIQTLEGFVITPRIVGQTVGLRESWVLVALFAGGEIFGFLGVLLAVPVAAVAKIFVVRGLAAYRGSSFFRAE
ncbi:MAG TPA: AI-2E family transporter [Polyangiaceae bacterium]|nr:AI-2E family transporter [Polyangiaceae bacterium]